MALKKIYFGSRGPYVYEDTDPVGDEDGDFVGEDYRALITNDQLLVERAPAVDNEVLRLIDLGYRLLPPVIAVNIDNPAELNTVVGIPGTMVLIYEIVGADGQNEYTIYAYDASGPAVNSPYVVDADGAGAERWIALTGKYFAQNLNISGNILLTGTVDGTDISVHVANVNAHHNQVHLVSSHSDTNLAGIANNDLWQWNDPASVWIPKSIQEVILSQNINPGNITMNDDAWIGIGAALERIIFDAAGDVSFMGCNVGVGTMSPLSPLDIQVSGSGSGWRVRKLGESIADVFEASLDRGGVLRIYDSGNVVGVYLSGDGALNSYILNGNFGVNTVTPTQPLSVKEKSSMTAIGGFAIKLTNETGVNSIAGQIVQASGATNDAVDLNAAGGDHPIAVFLESGVVDGDEAWVVVAGIADVAYDDNVAAVRGQWVGSGAVGYARTQAAPPAAWHGDEIGHCIESVAAGGAGTHILARCVLHFN